MTIKDIINDEELLNFVNEDLEDFDENTEVNYEVWAFGYDENDEITDAELCMFTSTDPEEAIKYAKSVELADIIHEAGNGPCASSKVFRIAIEVETVVPMDDDLVNVGTIYSKTVWEQETFEGPEEDDDDCFATDMDYFVDEATYKGCVYIDNGDTDVVIVNYSDTAYSSEMGFAIVTGTSHMVDEDKNEVFAVKYVQNEVEDVI